MVSNVQQTVRELALQVQGATRVFERAGIDYCCGGGRTLLDACGVAGVSPDEMLSALRSLEERPAGAELEFTTMSLTELAGHIVETHHLFTTLELARLGHLLDKVRSKHEGNHPEVADVASAFARLRADLIPHMFREEKVLFPYIVAMDAAKRTGGKAPVPPFGTVRNPIRTMMAEHETAGDLLAELRAATAGFAPPPDACMTFRALYDGLHDLEKDLHQHIHLENNILFPRAAELETE
jgi:regulator of cell morphogenesis and NO signaling